MAAWPRDCSRRLQVPGGCAASRPGRAWRSRCRRRRAALGLRSWRRGSSLSSSSWSRAAWPAARCTWRTTRACWEAASKAPKPSARRRRRCLQPSRNGRTTSAGSFHLLQNLTFLSLNPGTKEFTLPCRLCL